MSKGYHWMTPEERRKRLAHIARLRDQYGLTFTIIGKRLGLSPSTVGKLYKRAQLSA